MVAFRRCAPLFASLPLLRWPAAHASFELQSSIVPDPDSAAAKPDELPFDLLPSTAALEAPTSEHTLEEAANAQEIVSSFVQAFMNNQQLDENELECLSRQSGQAAGRVMLVSSTAVSLLEKVMGSHLSIKGLPSPGAPEEKMSRIAGDAASSISQTVRAIAPQGSGLSGEAIPGGSDLSFFYGDSRRLLESTGAPSDVSSPLLMLQLGASAKELVDAMHEVVKDCLHSDGRQAFERAAKHMQSLSYMSGHLVANGADVVTEVADAAVAFRQHNHSKFGHDMGMALRKVVLTHSTDASLPEGLPGKKTLANISEGLLRGFFGQGSELDMRLKQDPETIHIDLHECVGDNLEFFQDIWKRSMYFFAQRAMQTPKAAKTDDEKVEWGSALAYDMLELPQALRKCNLSPEEEEMLMDSIKALGNGVQLRVQMPGADESRDAVADKMAQSVKDWANTNWYGFGHDLGQMLQGLTATVYAKKYSLDSNGVLRKHLLQDVFAPADGNQVSRLSVVLFSLAAFLVPTSVALRRARERRQNGGYEPGFLVTETEAAPEV